jgi:hypothetical protein
MGEAQGEKWYTNTAPKGLNNELVCPVTDRFYIIWFSVQKIVNP